MSNENERGGSIWPAMTVLVGVIALAAVGWAALLQNQNKRLERRLSAIERTPVAPAPKALPDPVPASHRKGKAPATAATAKKLVSDEELALINDFYNASAARSKNGLGTPADVLRARRVLNRAKFLHGDLTREEFDLANQEVNTSLLTQLKASAQSGVTSPADLALLWDDILNSRQ